MNGEALMFCGLVGWLVNVQEMVPESIVGALFRCYSVKDCIRSGLVIRMSCGKHLIECDKHSNIDYLH